MKSFIFGLLILSSISALGSSILIEYPSIHGYALKATQKLALIVCQKAGKESVVAFTSGRLTYNQLQELNIAGSGFGLDRIDRLLKNAEKFEGSSKFIEKDKVDKTKRRIMTSVECE